MKFETPATTNPIDQLKVVGKPIDRFDGCDCLFESEPRQNHLQKPTFAWPKVWHAICSVIVQRGKYQGRCVTMSILLLVIVILFLVGGLPNWGYHKYGFAPSGFAGALLLVLVVLLLSGRL